MKKHIAHNKKVIAILLDAAEPSLVAKWIADGSLPVLASLYREGVSRVVASESDLSSPATYGAFRFSVAAGRHGTGFNHRQFKSGTYEVRKKYAEDTAGLPFWELFPEGTRSILLDVPNTYVNRRKKEVTIVGWGEEGLAARAGSNPKELFRLVNRRFGRHPLHGWYHRRPRELKGWLSLREKIFEGIYRRERVFSYLLSRHPWDFAAVNFSESHFVGHYFWHLMDEGHPDHDPALAAEVGGAFKETYKLLDRAVGRIIRDYPDAYVCVFSNTGMGPNYSGRHLVPEILSRLGWGAQKEGVRGVPEKMSVLPARRWGYSAVERLEESLGAPLIAFGKRFVPERMWDRWTRNFSYAGNDWSATSAFAIPTDYCGGIRVNLVGREPRGRVKRQDYDRVCRNICNSFAKLVNGQTGKSAVGQILRTSEMFGTTDYDFPDILVRWRRDAPIEHLMSDEIGSVRGVFPDKRSGAHTNDGFFVMKGPDIGRGVELGIGNLMDIGPTIVDLLGGDCGSLDGKVMRDMYF